MHAYLRPLSAAFALTFAMPASALWVPGREKVDPIVLNGTLDENVTSNGLNFEIHSPGRYRLSWAFDRPLDLTPGEEGEAIVIYYWSGWVYDDYEGGEWVGGFSVDLDHYFMTYASGSIMLEITEPRVMNLDPDGYYQSTEWEYLSGIGLYASHDEYKSPIGYRLTLTQVPEPATWAMMILGFGLVGAAARRRAGRTTPATA